MPRDHGPCSRQWSDDPRSLKHLNLDDATADEIAMTVPAWWAAPEVREDLDQVLEHVNVARDARNSIDACGALSRAVNKLFSMRAALSDDTPETPTDEGLFRALLKGLGQEGLDRLLASESVAAFADFRPLILDHYTLREHLIADVPPEAEAKAREPHERLVSARTSYAEVVKKKTRDKLVFTLVRMLWVVRSNLMHGEKSMGGPDRDRSKRNVAVAGAAAAVFADIVEAVLGSPSRRLAVYGTLAPGEVNHFVIEPAGGTWRDVALEGEMGEWAGYPMFEWVTPGETIQASLVESETLPSFWSRLDEFETKRYTRHLVPFTSATGIGVTNCYVRAANEWR